MTILKKCNVFLSEQNSVSIILPGQFCWCKVGSHWAKWNQCHKLIAEVSRCHTRGESEEFIACRWESTQVRDPPSFETQGRCHQKSKTGVSVKPRADVTKKSKTGYLWNPEQTSPEVQNRAISDPTKRICILQKSFAFALQSLSVNGIQGKQMSGTVTLISMDSFSRLIVSNQSNVILCT